MRTLLQILTLYFLTHSAMAQSNQVKVGQAAPDISLTKPDGTQLSLHSLKGKLVLIDFWATWCAPCVKEQPELKSLYSKFHKHVNDDQFEILGVSFDKNGDSWQKAIERLDISWPQVSDLKFWKSPVAKVYGIEELPFNVIVDAQGKVIAVSLHGKELEEFISNQLAAE